MTTLASYAPKYTVTIALPTTKRYCSDDLYIADALFKRKLMNSPSIAKKLEAIAWGDNITLEFDNSDGEFTTLLGSEEFRGKGVTLNRYEPLDAVPVTFELYGQIIEVDNREVTRITIATQDPDPFQTDLPKELLSHEWLASERPETMRPSVDNGKPFPLPFGYAKKIPLLYVREDMDGNIYDYAISLRPIEENFLRALNCYFTMVAAGNAFLYMDMTSVADYVVHAGDFLEYDINWNGADRKIALDLICSDASALRATTAVDQNGLACAPATNLNTYAQSKWYHRRIPLPAGWVGKTVQNYDIACEYDSGGAVEAFISHIYITDGAGNIRKKIWDPSMTVPTTAVHLDSGGGQSSVFALTSRTDAGATSPTTTVYRAKCIIPNSEFSVFNGGQYAPYSGFAFIRFYKQQVDFSGSPYELHADVRGLTLGTGVAERNFVRVIQKIINNSDWGVGPGTTVVDGASFDAAATAMASLYCDGAVITQRKAQDILNDLLWPCRGSIEKNSAGLWTIQVDTYQASSVATFDEDGELGPAILSIDYYRKTPSREAVKKYKLSYGWNEWKGVHKYSNERIVNATFGEDKAVESMFVRSHDTGDRITCFEKNLRVYGDTQLGITVGMDGRGLTKGQRIAVVISRLGINGAFQIRNITRDLTKFKLELVSYHADIYTYSAGTIPTDGNADSLPDYEHTAPDAPTSLTKVSEGVRQSTVDGSTIAYFELSAVLPAVNAKEIKFGYRKTGETLPYTYVDGTPPSSGNVWTGKIEGLIPGLAYDVIAVARNQYGLQSSPVSLLNLLAPGDITAPGTPTISAAGKIEGIEITVTSAPTDKDHAGYKVYRGFAPNPTTYYCKIDRVTKWTDRGVTLGSTYHYRYVAVDQSGNPTDPTGHYSNDASALAGKVSGAGGSGQIDAGTVNTADFTDNGVTHTKRQLVNYHNHSGIPWATVAAGSFTTERITHSLGRYPLLLVLCDNKAIICNIYNMDSSIVDISFYNPTAVNQDINGIAIFYW